jgi:hypothetical protein
MLAVHQNVADCFLQGIIRRDVDLTACNRVAMIEGNRNQMKRAALVKDSRIWDVENFNRH